MVSRKSVFDVEGRGGVKLARGQWATHWDLPGSVEALTVYWMDVRGEGRKVEADRKGWGMQEENGRRAESFRACLHWSSNQQIG